MTYNPLCKECGVYHDGYENCGTMTAQTNTLSDELVETVARAIWTSMYGERGAEHAFEFHTIGEREALSCARAALEASGIERIQEEARKLGLVLSAHSYDPACPYCCDNRLTVANVMGSADMGEDQ